MTNPPRNPKVYHITHIDNIPSIIEKGCILSDSRMLNAQKTEIGMSNIKLRRLINEVSCHAGTKVGEYTPFYFCTRSIMLYIIHMRNHYELSYKGGQTPILHLQSDFHSAVQWAEKNNIRWALSTSNAGALYTTFYNDTKHLDKINWQAVNATDFKNSEIKEGKQAEFLMFDYFPWNLIEGIGVVNQDIKNSVDSILQRAEYKPPTSIIRKWYY